MTGTNMKEYLVNIIKYEYKLMTKCEPKHEYNTTCIINIYNINKKIFIVSVVRVQERIWEK